MTEFKKRGLFISFEGIDGAGKSTHIQWLTDYLASKNIDVINTREPGGTELGEQMRNMLLNQNMHAKTEALLMFAARNEHIQRVIKPNLEKNICVISDRFTDASYAYQGGGRQLDINTIQTLENLVHPDLQPDCTLLFDLPLEIAQQRISSERKLDRFEQEKQDFFLRTKNAYLDRAQQHKNRFVVIDSSQSIEEIRNHIQAKIDLLLEKGSLN